MMAAPLARRLLAALILIATTGSAATVWLAACHDVYRPPTVASAWPLDVESYFNGELGVVRPTYAPRYLVQGYRVLNGLPPLGAQQVVPTQVVQSGQQRPRTSVEEWKELRRRVLGSATTEPDLLPAYYDDSSVPRRNDAVYTYFPNCHSDAFQTATRTLEERFAQFQENRALVVEWIAAQDAVFANCAGGPLVLPQSPSSASAIVWADYEYQTAAAYFYATEYGEAARRFRQIALTQSSPWQRYGHYLAARAMIRHATVPDRSEAERDQILKAAEAQLQDVLKDDSTVALHDSAQGLLGFVRARIRMTERLAELLRKLEREPTATRQDVEDYRWLSTRVPAGSAAAIDEKSSDLADWMTTLQTDGDEAFGHALERWRETKSTAWLVSVLWKAQPGHQAVSQMMSAAAGISKQSPAFATVAFLRVRLMLARGERQQARALLATLPTRSQPGFPEESINLLRAARMQLAANLDELLANSVRTIVDPSLSPTGNHLLEDDAARLLTYQLPLGRLVEASKSKVLPERERFRIAAAALSRALVLRRDTEAREAAAVLSQLAPSFRADVNRYLTAANEGERHRWGLLLMLRHVGMHAYVPGRRDFGSSPMHEWLSEDFVGSWWCTTEDGQLKAREFEEKSGIESLFLPSTDDVAPAFLTAGERAAARNEIAALVKLGQPQGYLAEEAIRWAEAAPQDVRAAEALASVVRRGRWSCSVPASSRRAFQTLHRLFPNTVWAQRTKYWYTGHQ